MLATLVRPSDKSCGVNALVSLSGGFDQTAGSVLITILPSLATTWGGAKADSMAQDEGARTPAAWSGSKPLHGQSLCYPGRWLPSRVSQYDTFVYRLAYY